MEINETIPAVYFQDLQCYIHASKGTQSERQVGFVVDDQMVQRADLVLKKIIKSEAHYQKEKEALRKIGSIADP